MRNVADVDNAGLPLLTVIRLGALLCRGRCRYRADIISVLEFQCLIGLVILLVVAIYSSELEDFFLLLLFLLGERLLVVLGGLFGLWLWLWFLLRLLRLGRLLRDGRRVNRLCLLGGYRANILGG